MGRVPDLGQPFDVLLLIPLNGLCRHTAAASFTSPPCRRGLRDDWPTRRDCGILSPAASVGTMPATNWHAALTAYA